MTSTTNSGYDSNSTYSTFIDHHHHSLTNNNNNNNHHNNQLSYIQNQFYEFIQNFTVHNHQFKYREQLHQNLAMNKTFLDIHFQDLSQHNQDLAHRLKTNPSEMLPLFEAAAYASAVKILPPNSPLLESQALASIHVTISSTDAITPIRDLNATLIGKLIRLSGIVIGASTLSAKATSVHIMCRTCQHTKTIPVTAGFSSIQMPRKCDGVSLPSAVKDCPLDPYIVVHDKCQFVDQQSIKLQETPDVVPVGELPRHLILSVDRHLVNRVMPGTRTSIIGVYSVVSQGEGKAKDRARGGIALRTSYIRAVGIDVQSDQLGSRAGVPVFTAEEEEEFTAIARRPDLIAEFCNSIAPSIFGMSDVKRAIGCLLFGGSKKRLVDGMRLRGDINVLLLGDPGVAKSQLLKFVERVAPISVYTSGKGSSAAGLTASVIRDPGSREFYLEGGAMVLADGGVVCIDEFDKMRDEDRVAIHEAMEQQTISIAKAGITTMLNSRTAVLAAANPVFGRYDDLKTAGENIDFQSTILSRFDMIFILKDVHDEGADQRIARHVMGIHKHATNLGTGNLAGSAGLQPQVDFDMQTMRRYISYARSRCAPRLDEESANALSSYFVRIRAEVREKECKSGNRAAVPVTVRQLEAIIRISESLAKMTLCSTVRLDHVQEAIRLFQTSTMNAVESGHTVDDMLKDELKEEIAQVTVSVLDRVPIGSQQSVSALIAEFKTCGISEAAVNRALLILVDRSTLQFRHQRKMIVRCGA